MGNEFAQKNEWDSNSQLQWNAIGKPEEGLLNLINDLNSLYKEYDDLHIDENFSWIDFNDVNNTVISFMRGNIVCIFNFTPVERENYAIGVDSPGTYTEIF
ncbi:alpha amylase C-terminal domain-containing protein [Acidiplasma cupricumulans]|nr:alpha amylase C-terminal domain-containing protein [Acidiplasma cupricumulans]